MVISVEPNNEYHQCPLFDTQLPNAIWSRSKNGKFWACHNWNKWLICQIVPNCPTGISNLKSGPSPHSFVVNPNTLLFSKKRYLSNHRVCNLKYWNVMIFWAILLQVLGYFIWKCLLAATRKWGEHLTTAAASSSLGRSRGLPARSTFEKFVILIDIANTFLAGSKHSKTVLWKEWVLWKPWSRGWAPPPATWADNGGATLQQEALWLPPLLPLAATFLQYQLKYDLTLCDTAAALLWCCRSAIISRKLVVGL